DLRHQASRGERGMQPMLGALRDEGRGDWRRFDLEPTRELIGGARTVSMVWIHVADLDRAFTIIRRWHARGDIEDYVQMDMRRLVVEIKASAPLGIEDELASIGQLTITARRQNSEPEEAAPVEELEDQETKPNRRINGRWRSDDGEGE